jgi:hypothetical protein
MDSNGSNHTYNFTYSDFVLTVGGQIMFLILLITVLYFGPSIITFPTNSVRKMVEARVPSNK